MSDTPGREAVPLTDLRPLRPEPPSPTTDAAMRDLPVALTDSRFAVVAGCGGAPPECRLSKPAWLAFGQERGHGRAAAEWAVYRLAEAGRVRVVWPDLYRMMTREALGAYIDDLAARLRGGRPPTVADWDLGEDGRILHIRSTPALWGWWRAELSGGGSAPQSARSGEQHGPRAHEQHPPSKDRQDDIITTIRSLEAPSTCTEIRDAWRTRKKPGKLRDHLSWMRKNGRLIYIKGQGYWPADDGPPPP